MKRSDISDKEIAEAIDAYHANFPNGVSPDQALASKYPAKLILSKMDHMCGRGLIEYGVSLRTAWLTDKGKELLEGK